MAELRALGLNLEMIEADQDEVDEAEIVEGGADPETAVVAASEEVQPGNANNIYGMQTE